VTGAGTPKSAGIGLTLLGLAMAALALRRRTR
jgi:uncharacterized protein (TIGR03382 family)